MRGQPFTVDFMTKDRRQVTLHGEKFVCDTHTIIQATDSCPRAGLSLLEATKVLQKMYREGLIK